MPFNRAVLCQVPLFFALFTFQKLPIKKISKTQPRPKFCDCQPEILKNKTAFSYRGIFTKKIGQKSRVYN